MTGVQTCALPICAIKTELGRHVEEVTKSSFILTCLVQIVYAFMHITELDSEGGALTQVRNSAIWSWLKLIQYPLWFLSAYFSLPLSPVYSYTLRHRRKYHPWQVNILCRLGWWDRHRSMQEMLLKAGCYGRKVRELRNHFGECVAVDVEPCLILHCAYNFEALVDNI